jgi:hypothetical protein
MKLTRSELKSLIRETLREELNKTKLNEKWETFDGGWGPVKLWYSDSVSEFRAFLKNAASAGIKGLRLFITKDVYLAARASELNHDMIMDIASDNYIVDDINQYEAATCGFPKVADFDNDNFEMQDEESREDFDRFMDARYSKLAGKTMLDPRTGEVLWVHDGKPHTLIADCGTFEVSLYSYYSRQFPEFKYGDDDLSGLYHEYKLFETSDLYFVLKPLIKRLYMT